MWDLIETANGWIVQPKREAHTYIDFKESYVFTTHAALCRWIKEHSSPSPSKQ